MPLKIKCDKLYDDDMKLLTVCVKTWNYQRMLESILTMIIAMGAV